MAVKFEPVGRFIAHFQPKEYSQLRGNWFKVKMGCAKCGGHGWRYVADLRILDSDNTPGIKKQIRGVVLCEKCAQPLAEVLSKMFGAKISA